MRGSADSGADGEPDAVADGEPDSGADTVAHAVADAKPDTITYAFANVGAHARAHTAPVRRRLARLRRRAWRHLLQGGGEPVQLRVSRWVLGELAARAAAERTRLHGRLRGRQLPRRRGVHAVRGGQVQHGHERGGMHGVRRGSVCVAARRGGMRGVRCESVPLRGRGRGEGRRGICVRAVPCGSAFWAGIGRF